MRVVVLVADHHPENVQVLERVLRARDFEVIATHDGGDALARFFEREPALVVCHEELPVLGGGQLSQQIKSQDDSIRVLIACEGERDVAREESLVASTGCDGVLFALDLDTQLGEKVDVWELRSEPVLDVGSGSEASASELFDLGDDDFDSLSLGDSQEARSRVDTESEVQTEPEAPAPLLDPNLDTKPDPLSGSPPNLSHPSEAPAAALEPKSDPAPERALELQEDAKLGVGTPSLDPVVDAEPGSATAHDSEASRDPETEYERAPDPTPDSPAGLASPPGQLEIAPPEVPPDDDPEADPFSLPIPIPVLPVFVSPEKDAPAPTTENDSIVSPPTEPELSSAPPMLSSVEERVETPIDLAVSGSPAEPVAPAPEGVSEPRSESGTEERGAEGWVSGPEAGMDGVGRPPELAAPPTHGLEMEVSETKSSEAEAIPAARDEPLRARQVASLVVETFEAHERPTALVAPAPEIGLEIPDDEVHAPPGAPDSPTEDAPPGIDQDPTFGAALPPPLASFKGADEAPPPVGVFNLPAEDPSGAVSNVFGELTSPLSTLEQSISSYAESEPQRAQQLEEEPLPEIELDDIAVPVPRARHAPVAGTRAESAPEALANNTPRSSARPALSPVQFVTPSAADRTRTAEELRQSLPVPGVDDLPMGPSGSLGLRGQQVAKLPPGIPSAGDLSTLPLPRLLYELYQATFSGILTLNRRGDRRRLFIWGGFPVRVETNQATENLGYMLLSSGRISESQYAMVEQKIRTDSLRAGDALRALNILSDRELLEAMRRLSEQRTVNTFAWRDGTYTFEARVDFADGTVFGEVHPLSVIWRGIHEHYDLHLLFDYFSSVRTRFIVATGMFGKHYAALGPFLRHLRVGELLGGQTTFEQALRSDDSRVIEISQLLYFLLVTDMIKPQVRPGTPPEELLDQSVEPESALPRAADYREISAASERIATEYLRLKDAEPREALAVPADADLATIDRALESATGPLTPQYLPPGLGDDMLRKVHEIIEMLRRAHEMLHEDAKRRAAAGPVDPEERVLRDAGDNGVDAGTIYRSGQSLLAEGRFKEAQHTIQQALALEPTVARYWIGLSQAFLLDDATSDEVARHGALNCLRRAVQVEPTSVNAHWEIGKLLMQLGLSSEAKDHLLRVVASSPEHEGARRLLSQL